MPAGPELLLARLETLGMRLGLEAFGRLLAELGQPQRALPVVLVAGTNGKGSTAALLAAMATAAGYRTGLYTSPHLESVVERLRLDGHAVSPTQLTELLTQVLDAAQRLRADPPTYFEALTAAALLHFAAQRVDLAVLEVGLGGRLDATNLAEPVLSVITEIGFDHCEHLGFTLAEIAGEKAGILRPERPAVAWISAPEAAAAVERRARELGCRLELVAAQVHCSETGGAVELTTPDGHHRLRPRLAGEHQHANLALAVRAAEQLRRLGWHRLDGDAIARGTAVCRWPGRLEEVPLANGRRLLLDAAHNPGGAAILGRHLATLGEPVDLLFGALADKDVRGMLPPLARHAVRVTLTRPLSSRALPPAALRSLLPAGASVTVEPELEAALDHALSGERLLVACGSIYLVGPVRLGLRRRFGVPEAAAATLTPGLGAPPH